MAETLGIDLGFMIAIGILVAIPAAIIIMFFIKYYSRRMDIPMCPIEGAEEESEPLPDNRLPGLLTSLLPIILPLLMISAHTIVSTLAKGTEITSNIKQAEEITAVLWQCQPGNVGFSNYRTFPVLPPTTSKDERFW